MRVLNFGSLNIDYVYQVDHFVQPGETMSARSLRVNCGGKGLNQSVALARAGVETWHAGRIGPEGRFLRETLDQAGVRTRFVEETEGSTGHAIIQVDPAGQNSILLYDGANGEITPEFVTRVMDQFAAGDTVLVQNETSCVGEIVRQAARRGMRVALNAAPANAKLGEIPPEAVTWLLVNEVEGDFLAGTEEPERMLDLLTERYPAATVVLTLGEKGAAACGAGNRVRVPRFAGTARQYRCGKHQRNDAAYNRHSVHPFLFVPSLQRRNRRNSNRRFQEWVAPGRRRPPGAGIAGLG